MASIFALLGVELKAPDHSTVSRRAMVLKSISRQSVLPADPAHILIDSTGLKVFGAGEWLQEKHGKKSRRGWRKLHLAVDVETQEIVALELTGNNVDDAECVSPILASVAQTGRSINSLRGNGAYDKKKVRQQLHGKGI